MYCEPNDSASESLTILWSTSQNNPWLKVIRNGRSMTQCKATARMSNNANLHILQTPNIVNFSHPHSTGAMVFIANEWTRFAVFKRPWHLASANIVRRPARNYLPKIVACYSACQKPLPARLFPVGRIRYFIFLIHAILLVSVNVQSLSHISTYQLEPTKTE